MLLEEWARFRAARRWLFGIVVAGALIMLPGVLLAAGIHVGCTRGTEEMACPTPPRGPDGEAVQDRFFFLDRQLDGDGSMTVRVGPMTGQIKDTVGVDSPPVPGVVPWAKAGIMIKQGVEQGATYAAVMTTSEHGVRMQANFTQDTAGSTSDRWLRLTRLGNAITGYSSPDGTRWTLIATAEIAGTARIGLFAASPSYLLLDRTAPGSTGFAETFAEVTATFDQVTVQGAGSDWRPDDIGLTYNLDGTPHHPGGVVQSGDTLTLTGVGDIAPLVTGPKIENTLSGLVLGLVVMIALAVLLTTTDQSGGSNATAPLASRLRSRGLVAKAAVVAGSAAVAGLVCAAVAISVGTRLLEANGSHVLPVTPLTEVRVILGAAALCGAVVVLGVAVGALLRGRVLALAVAEAALLVPYILGTALVLPNEVAAWLFRLTPLAGLAVLQSIPDYPQVTGNFVPSEGFYPLPAWGGLLVLGCYVALAMGLAVRRINRGVGRGNVAPTPVNL